MEEDLTMYSMTDMQPYNLPDELLFGSLRSTTEYSRNELLAEGAYSQVYRAKDNKLKKQVVLKFLSPSRSSSILHKDIFREISVLRNLNHENIVELYEVAIATTFNNLCLVLEYCPQSLSRILNQSVDTLGHDQVKCIAKHLFRGLRYLHKNHIAHRDIKTSNLMVSDKGVLKIIDFGLSRHCTPQNQATSPQVITRWYKPPEILLEAPTHGTEVDLWSAGCVIVELLTKEILFKGETDLQQINLIIDVLGKPVPNTWPDVVHCRVYKVLRFADQPFYRLEEKLQTQLNCGTAVPMLLKLFKYNPAQRQTAEECLQEEWFQKAPYPSKSISLTTNDFNCAVAL